MKKWQMDGFYVIDKKSLDESEALTRGADILFCDFAFFCTTKFSDEQKKKLRDRLKKSGILSVLKEGKLEEENKNVL